MVDTNPDEMLDEVDRVARAPDAARDGWQRTIEDTRAMAADREEAGYETLVLLSDDTAPVAPDHEGDHWGLTHLVPDNKGDEFAEFIEGASFDETGVYQAEDQGNIFLVTECIDLDAEKVVFMAGVFRMRPAVELVRAAMDAGEMHSHVRRLDGTVIGSIDHDDPDAFFPNPDDYYAFEPDYSEQMATREAATETDDTADSDDSE